MREANAGVHERCLKIVREPLEMVVRVPIGLATQL